MVRRLILLTVCLVMGVTISFSQSKTGNGKVKEETRSVSGFNAVDVSAGIDLYIKQGSTEKVVVKTDENLMENLQTTVSGGTLKITMKGKVKKTTKLEAHVTVRNLNALNASSGSDVEGESTITSDKLSINTSSGSDLELDVEVGELTLNISSGSDAKLSGKAGSLSVVSSSGSDLEAGDLEAKNCKIEASSGSDARVHCTGELEVRASSASDVVYSGNPTVRSSKASSGADITRKN